MDPSIEFTDLDEEILKKIFSFLSLKQLLTIERVNTTCGHVSQSMWKSVEVIPRSESLYGHRYSSMALKCPNLKVFDASRALIESDLMKDDDETSIGIKLAASCPSIRVFKGLGILGAILVSTYVQLLETSSSITEIELHPGTNREQYSVSELKNRYVDSIRQIVAKGSNIRKVTIVASFDWASLLCKTSEGKNSKMENSKVDDEESKSVLEVLASVTTSLRTNYDMIYRQMVCSGHQLQELNVEFNLSESFITCLATNHQNLVTLRINCPKSRESFQSLHSLKNLKKLEFRQITMGSITDYVSVFHDFLVSRGSLLVELSLVNVYVDFTKIWTLIGQKCSELKRFKVNRYWFDQSNQNEIFDTIIMLRKLKRLELLDFFHRRGFTKDQVNQMLHLKPFLTYIKYCPKTMNVDATKKAVKLFSNEVQLFQIQPEFKSRRPITIITNQF